MSITRTMLYNLRPWAIPQVPGYPAGYWIVAGDAAGDASGGELTWQHIFAQPSSGLGDPSSFYSIEQVMFSATNVADRLVDMLINFMDARLETSPSISLPMRYLYQLTAGISDSSLLGDAGVNNKIWVGRFSGLPTDAGIINLATANPGVAEQFRVKVGGYYWSPAAMNAAGGIIRPTDGIYGA